MVIRPLLSLLLCAVAKTRVARYHRVLLQDLATVPGLMEEPGSAVEVVFL